jgi:L-iditol 2-dehydrogenase
MPKAACLLKPGHIELKEMPLMSAADRGLVVKVEMAGICGTDRHIYDGMGEGIPYPIILGHENVGTIYEFGNDFETQDINGNQLSIGDRIVWNPDLPCRNCWYCYNTPSRALCENVSTYGLTLSCAEPPYLFGGWAEYIQIQPGTEVHKVPENMSSEVAVLNEPLASTNGVLRAMQPYPNMNVGFAPGQTALIQGAGTIGILAVAMAYICGAGKIILVGGPANRLEIAKEFGVDHIISLDDYPDPNERISKVLDLTDGRGADLVVECAGVPAAVVEGLDMIRKGGVFVEIGNWTDLGNVSINPSRHICLKDVIIYGQAACVSQDITRSLQLLNRYSSVLPFHKLITHKFKLEQIHEALEVVKNENCLKAVITP